MSLNAVSLFGNPFDWDATTTMVWLLIIVGAMVIITFVVLSVLIVRTRAPKEEPAPEPVSEPEPEPEPEPTPEPESEPVPVPVVVEEPVPVAEPAVPVVVEEESFDAGTLRYDRSFTAKLIQSDDETKQWYTELKNELLSWKKVHDRMSWKKESYRYGREPVAIMTFRGKTLCLLLPLNPDDYTDSKYKVENISDLASAEDTPCLYRIKNDRRVKYAKELIAIVMESLGGVRIERESVDYYMPYEGVVELIGKGLIKRKITYGNMDFASRPEEEAAVAAPATEPEPAAEPAVTEPAAIVAPIVVEEESVAGGTLRYDKSFTAKLIQSDDDIKHWYTLIKNHLLSYKKVHDRLGWKHETYRYGREPVAKIAFRGKSLCVYLPLNAADYAESKYKLEDVSDLASAADYPCVYRIKNDRRVKYTLELIDGIMQGYGSEKIERETVDYYVPYEGIVELIEKGLVKRKISTLEADAFLASRKSEAPAEEPAKDESENK